MHWCSLLSGKPTSVIIVVIMQEYKYTLEQRIFNIQFLCGNKLTQREGRKQLSRKFHGDPAPHGNFLRKGL